MGPRGVCLFSAWRLDVVGTARRGNEVAAEFFAWIQVAKFLILNKMASLLRFLILGNARQILICLGVLRINGSAGKTNLVPCL